jgi:hypothetical protein
MVIAPRVTIKGRILRLATSRPVAVPSAAVARTASAAAAAGPDPDLRIEATRTVVSATIEPTERSMPPAIMTSVMPEAAMPTTTVCRAIVTRFCVLPNVLGLRTIKIA